MSNKVDSLKSSEITYTKTQVLNGIEYEEWDTLKWRLSKIMEFLSANTDDFKKGRNYAFYREEKDILQFLLREFNDPVINGRINNTPIGKNLEAYFKDLYEFRIRMNERIKKVDYEPSRKIILETIDIICDSQIGEIAKEIMQKARIVREHVLQIPLAERIGFLEEINVGIEKWIKNNIA